VNQDHWLARPNDSRLEFYPTYRADDPNVAIASRGPGLRLLRVLSAAHGATTSQPQLLTPLATPPHQDKNDDLAQVKCRAQRSIEPLELILIELTDWYFIEKGNWQREELVGSDD
jgi:hypothetical protein